MTYPAGREAQLADLAARGFQASAEWRGLRIGQFGQHVAATLDVEGSGGDVAVAAHGLYPALETWPVELVEALESVELVAHLSGRFDARPGGPLGYASPGSDPFDLPFDEAISWFQDRDVVTSSELAQLRGAARSRAFYVGGVQDRRLADRFHGEIAKAVESGTGFAEFVEQMDLAATDLGVEPFGLGKLSNVFRNATGSAYQAGRHQQLTAQTATRPIWEYYAVPGARPEHAAQDGTKRRHDDPYWLQWFPLNGHGCRCTTGSLTEAEAGPLTDVDLDSFAPPDWPQSPAREPQAAAKADGVATQLDLFGGPLPSTRIPNAKLLNARPGQLDLSHSRAMTALDRGADLERLALLQDQAGVDAGDLVELLGSTPRVHLHPPTWKPSGVGTAELALPSQDGAGLEELARRLAHVPDLAGAQLQVRTRITVSRNAPPLSSSTSVLDHALAGKLGDADPAAWVGEAVLELVPESPDQLAALSSWVLDNAERGRGPSVVPFVGDAADLRLVGDAVDVAPNATLNVRPLPSGWQASATTSEPLDGWTHYPATVPGNLELD